MPARWRRDGDLLRGYWGKLSAGATITMPVRSRPGVRGSACAITPGYHLDKRHWNTITLDGSVPDDELLGLIDHSYELVVARLPRAERDEPDMA